jgi:hypothetical protein
VPAYAVVAAGALLALVLPNASANVLSGPDNTKTTLDPWRSPTSAGAATISSASASSIGHLALRSVSYLTRR